MGEGLSWESGCAPSEGMPSEERAVIGGFKDLRPSLARFGLGATTGWGVEESVCVGTAGACVDVAGGAIAKGQAVAAGIDPA